MARVVHPVQRWKELAAAAHFNANELARLCGLSIRQLQREFRRRLGRSPQNWLNEQRIIAAGQLLLAGTPVKTVAFELGFKQASHFSRQFKSQCHMPPSKFAARSGSNPVRTSLTDM